MASWSLYMTHVIPHTCTIDMSHVSKQCGLRQVTRLSAAQHPIYKVIVLDRGLSHHLRSEACMCYIRETINAYDADPRGTRLTSYTACLRNWFPVPVNLDNLESAFYFCTLYS